jgi:putative membrane protein
MAWLVALAPACGDDDSGPRDAAVSDAGKDGGGAGRDASMDAAVHDAGGHDAGRDAGGMDSGAADAGALSDSQIASVMTAINSGSIQRAQVAIKRTSHSSVVQFATVMMTDHRALNTALVGIMQMLSIAPIGSAQSAQIANETMRQIARLRKESGGRFDADYVQTEIGAHEQAIHLIDSILLPQVDATLLRNQLKSMRMFERGHLDEARKLQQELEGDAGAEDGGA